MRKEKTDTRKEKAEIRKANGAGRLSSHAGGMLPDAVFTVAAAAALFALVWFTCRHTLCWQQSVDTYISGAMDGTGIVERTGLWFTGRFGSPLQATLITGGLLTAVCVMWQYILRRLSGTGALRGLSLVPAVYLGVQHCQPGYHYGVTVAFAVVAAVMCLGLISRSKAARGAGALAALVLICLILADGPHYRRLTEGGNGPVIASAIYVALPVVAWLCSRRKKAPGRGLSPACYAVGAVCAAAAVHIYADPGAERMHRLYLLSADGQWDEIIQSTREADPEHPEVQPLRNLALAHQGKLADLLFQQPCADESAIYPRVATPEAFVILSDIHYASGELALARRYAFEANEAYGNRSPRLLKRLTDINLITGDYAVAGKYLNLLDRARVDSQWVSDRRRLLENPQAVRSHAELGRLAAALETGNRFAGMPNNEEDLRKLIAADSGNSIAIQYLGCELMLKKKIPEFAAMIEELDRAGSLPQPMPVHFQEGIAVASLATDEDLSTRYRIEPGVVSRCAEFWQGRASAPGTLWEYLR